MQHLLIFYLITSFFFLELQLFLQKVVASGTNKCNIGILLTKTLVQLANFNRQLCWIPFYYST